MSLKLGFQNKLPLTVNYDKKEIPSCGEDIEYQSLTAHASRMEPRLKNEAQIKGEKTKKHNTSQSVSPI